MISTREKDTPGAKRPAFVTLLCELGVMLFVVAAWAHARGTLVGASWEPVFGVAIAGLLFGPVKFLFVEPERAAAQASRGAFIAHLLKTAVLAMGCAVAAVWILN